MNRLDEIEARANAATDGPWFVHGLTASGNYRVSDRGRWGAGDEYEVADDLVEEDAEFIANARTDVPALIAALRAVLALDGPMSGENSGAEYMAAVHGVIASALGGES